METKVSEGVRPVNSLGEEKIGKLLLKYSVPCILSLLVSALYNIVDQIFIGQGVGYLGNAATNVVYPVTVIALGFSLLIGDGCAAKYSLSLGEGDHETGKHAIGNSIAAITVIGVIISIVGFIHTDQILRFFGATDNCIGLAGDYMRVILLGIPFYMFTSGMNAVIRADGSPAYSMISMVIGCVINLILDPVSIFILHMGVTGAAAATVIGQAVSCIFTIVYFFHPKSFRLDKSSWIPDLKLLGKVALFGISSFITQISIVVVCAVTNNIMVRYGTASEFGADIPLSVIGIVMKVFSIIVSIVVGIAVGGQPIAGYNYGAGKYERVMKTYKLVATASAIVGAVAMFLFEVFPKEIISIFGSEGETYTRFAVLCFRIYLGGILLGSIQKSSCIFLQSIGKPIKATLLSLSRDIFFLIPAVIILPIHYGIVGALWSAPLADILSMILTVILISIEYKKLAVSASSSLETGVDSDAVTDAVTDADVETDADSETIS